MGRAAPQGDRAGAAERAGASHAGNYAGRVEGTDAFVAVVVDGDDRALAYVCDGQEDGQGATVAEWLTGAVAGDGSLKMRSEGGARLVAEVVADGASGTLTLSGEEHAFSASPAEEPAGLYRAEETVDGEGYLGGWIELPNGEVRGAVNSTSSGFVGSDIELARPQKPVNGFVESDVEL